MKKLGDFHVGENMLERGLKYIVQGCLANVGGDRSSSEWLHQFHELIYQVQFVLSALDLLAQEAKEKNMILRFSFPLPKLRDYFYHALCFLMLTTELVYGKDTAFYSAIRKWHLDAKAKPEHPQISNTQWLGDFNREEDELFQWADLTVKSGKSGFGWSLIKQDTGETASSDETMTVLKPFIKSH